MKLFEIEMLKGVVFTFIRANPFHWGHMNLIQTMINEAKKREYSWYLFLSSKQEPEKNPLTYEQKIYWIKKLFPTVLNHIVEDQTIKNPLQAATFLYQKGYRNAVFVAGEDDMPLYSKMIYSGNEHGEKHPELLQQGKAFFFDNLDTVISPRLTSATSVRKTVAENDPVAFAKAILGPNYSKTDESTIHNIETNMFNQIRQGMTKSEKPIKKNKIKENITKNIRDIQFSFISEDYHKLFRILALLNSYTPLSNRTIKNLKHQLDLHKHDIIKIILLNLKGDRHDANMIHFKKSILHMKILLGIDWPELDIIQKSLEFKNKLTK